MLRQSQADSKRSIRAYTKELEVYDKTLDEWIIKCEKIREVHLSQGRRTKRSSKTTWSGYSERDKPMRD